MKNRRYSERLVIAANQNIKEKDYWLNKLSGELVKSSFPYDSPKEVGELPVDSLEFRFPGELYQRVIKLSKGSDHSLHLLLVTVLVLLLNKYSYSANNDIIVGVPIEKQAVDKEFVNTVLLLRNRLKDNMTFKQLILEVRHTIVEAIENYNYPVEVLYEQLELSDLPVKGDEDPLVGVGILLENIHDKAYIRRIAPDVTFLFLKEENSMQGRVEYRRHLYEKTTIQQVIDHLTHLMGEALFNVDTEINNISILSPEERKQVLDEFNHSGKRYPRSPTVVELFASQVNMTPDKIALVDENSWLTYSELNSRSDYLACLLRTRGVSPGSIIGLMVKPSFSMMVGIIGVLKAGGAYLPVAPDWPEARVKFMMSDSNARILLSEVSKVSGGTEVIDLPSLIVENKDAGSTHLTHLTHPTHLCYVIYTSGSTGRPKGVPITHGNLTPLLLWSRDYFGFGEHTRVLQNLSYTFDFGAFELLTTLISGGALYFFDKAKMTSTSEYVDFIHLHEINTLHTTPSFLSSILIPGQQMHTLGILHLGGERLTGKLIRDVSQQLSTECRIYNGYGPTETTINSSIFETGVCMESRYDYPMKIMDNTPIGIPSANNIIFIMDTHMNLLPVGVPGELYIGGGGVAPGYLNRPELTAEKFLFSSYRSNRSYWTYISKKLYKTGDLGCWLVDGNIEFLGRIDHQVKIRGLRVELGEIERRLLTYQDIKDVLVICRDDYLCAYIVPGDEISITELRGYISEELPDYMVPSFFVSLERMPLTASGKVDRNALPDPKTGVRGVEYTPPVGFFEEQLVGIWSELLRVETDQISVHGDFFELGGHSLLATSMAARIHKHFDVKVPLEQILKTPTVSKLAEYIKVAASKDRYFSIQPVEKKDYYVLSPAQKRMYILQQMDLDSTGCNMPVIEAVEGDVDKEKLRETFRKIIERHESLRTSFHMVAQEPVQRVHDLDQIEVNVEVKVKTHSHYSPHAAKDIIQDFVRPFDLSQAPLLRVELIYQEKSSGSNHVLLVDMHHIISDAVSMNILMNDFRALLGYGRVKKTELPELQIQYKDYAEWHNREQQKESIKKQELYWLTEFAGDLPVLDLPADYDYDHDYDNEKQFKYTFVGAKVTINIDKEKIVFLRQLTAQQGIPMFVLLLAIFYVLLSKISGQEDIVVGVPIDYRRYPDLETIIGLFANILALRTQPTKEKTFNLFLEEVKEKSSKAFNNREYPLEDLVEKLSEIKNTRYDCNPLFKVMYNFMAIQHQQNLPEWDTLEGKGMEDILLMGVETGDDLSIVVEYNAKRFNRETIEKMLEGYLQIISALKKTKGNIKPKDIELESDLLTLEEVSLDVAFNI